MKRIAYITDIHLDEKFPVENGVNPRKNWKLILEDVANKNIDEIIFGGDIGEKESNQWFFESLKDFKINIILGNHDHFSEVLKHYSKDSLNSTTRELYYSYEDNCLKYIFLDSSSGEIIQNQYQWFKRELITDKKVILFIHHPVLGVETAVDKQFPLRGRKKINEELQNFSQEVIIFCGHYHMNDERTIGNVNQFITPSASYQIRKNSKTIEVDNSTFGYRIININKDKIDSEIFLHKDGFFVAVT